MAAATVPVSNYDRRATKGGVSHPLRSRIAVERAGRALRYSAISGCRDAIQRKRLLRECSELRFDHVLHGRGLGRTHELASVNADHQSGWNLLSCGEDFGGRLGQHISIHADAKIRRDSAGPRDLSERR